MSNHLVNPDLIAMAFQNMAKHAQAPAASSDALNKQAFVPAGDPNMGGGAPSAGSGGGAGGPAAGAPAPGPGGPPPAPAGDPGGGGGGGTDPSAVAQAVVAGLQPMLQGGMGGGAGGVEPLKPKIDVNVTMLQILKLLARISDALGIPVPASEMVATSSDLTQFAQQQQTGAPGGPGAAPGGGGAGPGSAIAPINPIQPAAPGLGGGGGAGGPPKTAADMAKEAGFNNGRPFAGSEGFSSMGSRAAAVSAIRRRQHR